MKKLLSMLLVCVILAGCIPFCVSAEETSVFDDPWELVEKLEKQAPLNDFIDISEFKIPYNNDTKQQFREMCFYSAPLLFHVDSVGFMPDRSGEYIKEVTFKSVYDTNEEYISRYNACMEKANELLDGVRGNAALDDVTKALILHDRLAAICRYDTDRPFDEESDGICGPFINGKAICTGYTSAYMYLLRQVGVHSRICLSREMDHAWLILNIDGMDFHVDVTFDDIVPDITGRVSHDYFMVSTDKLKDMGREGNDWDTSPQSALYDNAYWRCSDTVFQVIGGDVFYLDKTHDKEAIWRVGDTKPLCLLDDYWMSGPGTARIDTFHRLSSDGTDLLYSAPKAIRRLDIKTGKSHVVYIPELNNEFKNIFGFRYSDGYLIYSADTDPDFNQGALITSYSDLAYQKRVPYNPEGGVNKDTVKPAVSIKELSRDSVTLTLSDNEGIGGYCFGDALAYGDASDIIYTTDTEVEIDITAAGEYYFAAVDKAGNLSEPVYKSFFDIVLVSEDSTYDSYVIAEGEEIELPMLSRQGWRHEGWSYGPDSGVLTGKVYAEHDTVLYALWTQNPEAVVGFEDVKTNHWFAEAVEYVVERGYMNGMSATRFSPNTNITREQFVLILANIAGADTEEYKFVSGGFADVKTGRWYSGAITWAVRQGYVSGMSKDRFGLGRPIQRAALARLLYVYADSNGIDVTGRADLSSFGDAALFDNAGNQWMTEPVQWAVDAGIISGMNSGGKLCVNPKGTATRAQAAVMLMKFDALI